MKLNLGCGKDVREGFVNVDMHNDAADVKSEMREYMKTLSDNSVEHILASHVVEHIPFHEVPHFLEICHRVLQPGGLLEIVCPDIDWWIENYVRGIVPIEQLETMVFGHRHIEGWGHEAMVTEDRLAPVIRDVGFVVLDVYKGDSHLAIHATKELS